MAALRNEDRQSPRPGPSGLQAPPVSQQPSYDGQEDNFAPDPPFSQGEVVYDHNGISASLELSHTSFYSRFGWRDHLYNIDFQVHEPEDSLLLDLNSVVADCLTKLLDKLKEQYAATSEDPRAFYIRFIVPNSLNGISTGAYCFSGESVNIARQSVSALYNYLNSDREMRLSDLKIRVSVLDHAHRQNTLRGGARRRIHDGVDFVGFGFPMQKKRRWLLYHDWEGLLQLKMSFSCLPLGILVALYYQSSLIKKEKRTREEEERATKFIEMEKLFRSRRRAVGGVTVGYMNQKLRDLCQDAGVNPIGPHALERDATKFGVSLGQQIIVLSTEELHYRYPEVYDPSLPTLFLYIRRISNEEHTFLLPVQVDYHINAIRDLEQFYRANRYICLFCGHSTKTNSFPHSCKKHKVCFSCHRPTRGLLFWNLPPLLPASFYCSEEEGVKRAACKHCNLFLGQGDCIARHEKFKYKGFCLFYRCLQCDLIWYVQNLISVFCSTGPSISRYSALSLSTAFSLTQANLSASLSLFSFSVSHSTSLFFLARIPCLSLFFLSITT